MDPNSQKNFFLHPLAICESKQIGSATRIWGHVHILSGAVIGKNCNICEHVFIENKVRVGNDCTIKTHVNLWDYVTLEDGVFVGPAVAFTNELRPQAFQHTLVQRGATLGANSTILCGVTVGAYSMVGAGCVVLEDVEPHALVVGNPARIIGRVCFCGESLDAFDFCRACETSLAENSENRARERHGVNRCH